MGHLELGKVFLFDRAEKYPIVASHFPGWTCDVCRSDFYDPGALSQLRAMLWAKPRRLRSIQAVPPQPDPELHPKHRDQRRHP